MRTSEFEDAGVNPARRHSYLRRMEWLLAIGLSAFACLEGRVCSVPLVQCSRSYVFALMRSMFL